MSDVKEPNHFGSDVRSRSGLTSRRAYLRLFAEAGDARIVGEASIGYLGSRDAAVEIAAFAAPDARLIAMVREPIGFLRSIHNHFVVRGMEPFEDLGAALDAGPERFAGRRTGQPALPELLDYRAIVRHGEQLQRWLEVFPKERLHVVILEELSREPARVFRDVLRFLDVDDSYRPDFVHHNAARRTDRRRLSRLINAPPMPLRRVARRFVPPGLRERLWNQRIRRPLFLASSRVADPEPIDPALEARLRVELGPEVHRLAAVIDRPDLPALWGYPAPAVDPVPH